MRILKTLNNDLPALGADRMGGVSPYRLGPGYTAVGTPERGEFFREDSLFSSNLFKASHNCGRKSWAVRLSLFVGFSFARSGAEIIGERPSEKLSHCFKIRERHSKIEEDSFTDWRKFFTFVFSMRDSFTLLRDCLSVVLETLSRYLHMRKESFTLSGIRERLFHRYIFGERLDF